MRHLIFMGILSCSKYYNIGLFWKRALLLNVDSSQYIGSQRFVTEAWMDVCYLSDFTGDGCEIAVDYCGKPSVCGQRGRCSVHEPDTFECDCMTGQETHALWPLLLMAGCSQNIPLRVRCNYKGLISEEKRGIPGICV